MEEHGWIVTEHARDHERILRMRANMLELVCPFGAESDPLVDKNMTCIQRYWRGKLTRFRYQQQQKALVGFRAWRTYSQLLVLYRNQILCEHFERCASVIQRAFRGYVSRWSRPNVLALLRRLEYMNCHVERLELKILQMNNSTSITSTTDRCSMIGTSSKKRRKRLAAMSITQ